jgi:hypothetical protein
MNAIIKAATVLFLALIILSQQSDLFAGTSTVHVDITVKMHLQTMHVPGTDGTLQTLWTLDLARMIKDLPGSSSMTTPKAPQIDAAILKRVQEIAASRLSAGITLPPGIVYTIPLNVDDTLEFTAPPAHFTSDEPCENSPNDLPDPAPGAQPQCRGVHLEGDLVPINSIGIDLISHDTSDPVPIQTLRFKDVASKLHITPRPDDDAIQISVTVSSSDRSNEPKDDPTSGSFQLLAEVRDMLDQLGLRIGMPGGNDLNWGFPPTAAVEEPFTISLPGSSPVQSLKVEITTPENELRIRLREVQFAHDVKFQAAPGVSADAVNVVGTHYNARFRRLFVGRVVHAQDLGRVVYDLKIDPYVKDVHVSYVNNILTFSLDTNSVIKNVALQWGGGYRPETGIYGSFATAFENLGGRGDKLDSNISAGPHLANVAVSASIPESPHPYDAGFHFLGLTQSGTFLYNNKTHFQTLGTDESSAQERLLSGIVKLGLDSFSAHDLAVWPDASITNRKHARSLFTLFPGYEIGLLQTTDKKTNVTVTKGQITAFSAQPTYLLDWDLRKSNSSCGLSELKLTLDSSISKGVHALGADFAYDSVLTTGTAELSFGIQEPYQFLVRERAGAGSVSHGTPLQRLFQIGGADYVRGLERGEFTANTLVWQRSEAGINFTTLLNWIRSERCSSPATPCNDSQSPQLPFNLHHSYLEVFFDHARVSPGTSYGNTDTAGRVLQGYGIALELGKLQNTINLSIGYGYSAQSTLHPHGVMFVGVTLQ